MTGFLTSASEVGPRPDPDAQPVEVRYVRSYLWMRIGIGLLAVLLPLLLVFGDKVLFSGEPFLRGSLSAYYYSGMRDEFVGILSATGVFLLTYKVAEFSLDNVASVLAGVCAALVALFPTGRPAHPVVPLAPLQDLLGETTVKTVHFAASAGFLVSLAVLSFVFGVREGKRPPRKGKRSPTFWRWFHWACTFAMAVAIAWIIVTLAVGWPNRALLWGEWASAWAFGLSWLAKGAELDMLFSKPSPPIDTSDLAEPATGTRGPEFKSRRPDRRAAQLRPPSRLQGIEQATRTRCRACLGTGRARSSRKPMRQSPSSLWRTSPSPPRKPFNLATRRRFNSSYPRASRFVS